MFASGTGIADRFVLIRRLGGGAQAEVWEAHEPASGGKVALKLQRDGARARAVEAQLEALRGSAHPGLLAPRECLRAGDVDVMVMPLAEAGDLSALRGRGYREFLPKLVQVAQALAYLHDRGLVHGDVKASNVLVDSQGNARLADFANLRAAGAPRAASDPISPWSASPQQRGCEPAQAGDDIHAFGALLGELLAGVPPGYSSEAAPGAARGPIVPVQPAPGRLVELAERCLRPSVAERPASMHDVAVELAGALQAPPGGAVAAPVLTPPKSAADALRANWQRAATNDAPDPEQLRRQGFRSGLVVTAAVGLGLVALALFIVPAVRAPVPAPHVAASAASAASQPAEPAAPAAPVDLEALAQQKSVADELRAGVSARLTALVTADSSSWAAAPTRAAQEQLAAADALMQKRDFTGALGPLRELQRALGALEALRGSALRSALQRGQAALDANQSAPAAAAFAAALRIAPNDAAALRGARRAASLDAVNARLAQARQLEQQGQIAAAGAVYRQALALDADAPEAQRGVARTGDRLRDDQFGRAMAQAYTALNAGHAAQAQAALDEARRLKPAAPELAQATAQLAAQGAAAQLAAALAQAHAAESAERWSDAVTQYQRALALDPTLVDARRALEIAQQRAQLSAELAALIAHPERAYTDAVYAAAQATLQRARGVASPGPLLSAQVEQVAALLGQAATPVNVTLRSDNLTTVTVYRIGALGNFTERGLQLKPGRYVVVGTRTGYRDVRRELNVLPGQAPPALQIQCVEPI